MKMKMIAAVAATTLAIGSLLTGCGGATSNDSNGANGSNTAGQVQNLEFWYALPGDSGNVVKNLVQSFNDSHKDIHVNATYIPTGERLQKLTAALGAGNPPDLYTAGPPDVGQLRGSGQIAEISALTQGKLAGGNYFDAPRGVAEADGKLWAVPASAGVIGLYYNQDLFTAAGIAAAPKNWDELIANAQKIADASKQKYGIIFPTSPDLYTTTVWLSFLWQNGGDVLTPDGKKAAFNSKEGVEALQLWVDLIHKYKVAPLLNLNENTAMQNFGTGSVGMIPAMPVFVESAKKFPFKAATSVLPQNKKQATTLGGWYIVIPNKSKHQQAAADFLQWLMQPDNIAQWNIGTGSVPTSTGVRDSKAYQDYLTKSPLAKAFADEMTIAKAPPAVGQFAQISTLIATAINNALYQKQTPQQALDEAAQKADALLAGGK